MIVTYWLAAALALLVLAAAFIRAKRSARNREESSHSARHQFPADEAAVQANAFAKASPLKERLFEPAVKREQPLVLIVDDGNALRMLMAEMLQEEGYCVLQACTGREAIDTWLSEKPDCVLLDIRLPDISGIDVLREIRKANNLAPVALMTAFADADMLAEARKLVFHCLLDKPFDLLHVKQAVREMAGGMHHREIS
ncbi:response regulator [Paenibacillus sp. NPDC057967]|uniref:response regulator n=1 Tax=Paenibacillus sp. NPDC057967 TaxID=3346293 RepID=UPI0036DB6D09